MRCFNGVFCSVSFLGLYVLNLTRLFSLLWRSFWSIANSAVLALFLAGLCGVLGRFQCFFLSFTLQQKSAQIVFIHGCRFWVFKAWLGRAGSNLWLRRLGCLCLVRLTSQSTTITTQPITVSFFILLATLHMLILLWVVTCYLCC